MRARSTVSTAVALLAVVASTALAGGRAIAEPQALNLKEVAFEPIEQATHLEFMAREVAGQTRHYALLGSRAATREDGGGLNVFDITDPETPVLIERTACVSSGGAQDPKAFPVDLEINDIRYDTMIAVAHNDQLTACSIGDRSAVFFVGIRAEADPGDPDGVTFDFLGGPIKDAITGGTFNGWQSPAAHTIVNHPTRPILYVGNQQIGDRTPSIEIINLEVWPPTARSFDFMPAGRTTTGVGPHDITFHPDGTRAYAAGIAATVILDTTGDKVLAPELVGITKGGRIDHEAVLHPNDRHLAIVDEFIATSEANAPVCPGGGIHFFDLGPRNPVTGTHASEASPVEVGVFFAQDFSTPAIRMTPDGPEPHLELGCTAHEFNYAPDGSWMPIAWYGAGVRVLDLSALNAAADLPSPTPVVVPEIGYYLPEGIVEFWSAKVHPADPGYIVASDTPNGLRILKLTGDLAP